MVRLSRIVCLAMLTALVTGAGKSSSAFDGYVLYSGHGTDTTKLIDGTETVVKKWIHSSLPNNKNGYSCYLLENGNLLRSAQSKKTPVSNGAQPLQGVLQEIDSTGKVVWTYELADSTYMLHHDCKVLPNGNLLVVAFVRTPKATAIAMGLDSTIFPVVDTTKKPGWGTPTETPGVKAIELEKIMEVKIDKTGGNQHQVVWEWKISDHIVPKAQAAEHPEKFSGGLGPSWFGQWVHLNGIDYNPAKKLIVFTSRIFSEVYIIDHSTTTQEAATGAGGKYGKGGDLLFRWGHAENYGISEANEGYELTTLHSPTWIPDSYEGAGNIMFYHNNAANINSSFVQKGRSEVVEIKPVTDASGAFVMNATKSFDPATPTWKYNPSTAADSMYSYSMSSAIRMKNGNTIVHEAVPPTKGGSTFPGATGASRLREVKKDGTLVWGPVNLTLGLVAKVMYYEKDYVGITKLLASVANQQKQKLAQFDRMQVSTISVHQGAISFSNVNNTEISLYTLQGKMLLAVKPATSSFSLSTRQLSAGSYFVKVTAAGSTKATKAFSVM